MTTSPLKPGWYPDPDGGPKQRYWDGAHWHKQAPSAKLAGIRQWAADLQERNASYARVPRPGGAQWVSDWELTEDTMLRHCCGAGRGNRNAFAQVVGVQYTDSTVQRRSIRISAGDLSATARES
jgi:Protein of unknown function (DUF2510)